MRHLLTWAWRLLRIASGGPGSRLSLLVLALVVALQLGAIQISLRFIQWNADFYNALQKIDVSAALSQVGLYAALTALSAGVHLVSTYARQHLEIRWRRRLTHVVMDRWLSTRAYWFLPHESRSGNIDNPDQRIADDCREFIESILTKVLGFFISLIGLYAFASLLWRLSTFPLAFTLFGVDVEIPRYMVWAAPIYAAIATVITHALGHQLSGLLHDQQRREADFRFSLMRLRENAAAIALSRGEGSERGALSDRFETMVGVWRGVINRQFIYGLFQRPYFQTVLRVPMFLALPAFLAGKVTLGGLMQLASAFQNVVTTLSWFIFNYKFISDLAATTRRLTQFLDAIDRTAAATGPHRRPSDDGALRIPELAVTAPDGRHLLKISDLIVHPGETAWINGASGLGKSTLLKALGGLWRHASGEVHLPAGRLCFMPQQVYMPAGTLHDAAIYPARPDSVPHGRIVELLEGLGLGHRVGMLDDSARGLSVGEQQRLALVRLVLAQPDWAFLDEATSALDPAAERAVFAFLRGALPQTTFVIVAHRAPPCFADLRQITLQRDRSEAREERSIASQLPQGLCAFVPI
ncbi:MAG: ABC transporter ATP-binding protein/permease [Variibacter sp.]